MASFLKVNSLGWQQLSHRNATNLETFPVMVRRQDSTVENVMLMDELTRFLEKEMPDAVNKYLAYPQSFEYNLEGLKGILDFPEEAQTRFSTSTPRTKRQGAC